MRSSRGRLAAVFTAAVVAAALVAPTALASRSTRPTVMVDDDGSASRRGCNNSGPAETTIQAGIDAAPDGAQILVCPGTYEEEVLVDSRTSLLIKAVKSFEATILDPGDVKGSISPAIFTIAGSDDIYVSGFRIVHENDDKCSGREAGAWILASRGVQFRGNRVLSDGPYSLSGCVLAIGILVGIPDVYGVTTAGVTGTWPFPDYDDWATTATIYANTVQDYAFAGIVAVSTALQYKGGGEALGRTDALIQSNSVRYMHTTEDATECDELLVESEVAGAKRLSRLAARLGRAIAPSGTPGGLGVCPAVGIYSGAGTTDSPIAGAAGQIKSNQVFSSWTTLGPSIAAAKGNIAPIPLAGIVVFDQLHASGAVTLYGNRVTGHFLGIGGADARGLAVKSNTVQHGYVGIGIWDTDFASVLSNKAQYNYIGIVATDEDPSEILSIENAPVGDPSPSPAYPTKNVTFKSNYANYNYMLSCLDDTSGSRTLGTANIWTSNKAEAASSSPAGICGGATPAPTATP
ncbi:MAG: hypothetical protein ACKOTZ_04970 [Chloroflexota bacterium]